MKILYVTCGYYPESAGGVERYTHDVAQALSVEHEVTVFTRSFAPAPNYALRRWRDGSVNVYSLAHTALPLRFIDTYQNPTIDQCFSHLLTTLQPDLVHVQHCDKLSLNVLAIAQTMGRPTIATLHDYWYFCPLRHDDTPAGWPERPHDCLACFAAITPRANRWLRIIPPQYKRWLPTAWRAKLASTFSGGFSRPPPSPAAVADDPMEQERHDRAVRAVLNGCAAIWAPARLIAQRHRAFGITHPPYVVKPLSVTTGCRPQRKKVPATELRFAYLGNFYPGKGIHVLADAFTRLNQRRGWRLTIWGDPAPAASYAREIRRRLRYLPVTFPGGYCAETIETILADIDAVILPTLLEETYPLVIHEAFTAKIPVIASRIGGIPEMVADGINGLLITPGNGEELRHIIMRLLSQPTLLEKLRRGIPEMTSMAIHAREVLTLYQQLVRARSSSHPASTAPSANGNIP